MTEIVSSTGRLTWRTADFASWESADWHWFITSRPVNYPDNGGPRTYSVRDQVTREWVQEDFETFEAAAAYCEEQWRQELAEIGVN